MNERNGSDPELPTATGIPMGFRIQGGSLEFVKYRGGRPEWIRISDPLHVVALTPSESGGDWGRLLRWRDPLGIEHEWAMPMSLLSGDGKEYRQRLLEFGLGIEASGESRAALTRYISACRPVTRAMAVTRLGWHDGPLRFILPDCTYGDKGEMTIFQPTEPVEHAFYTAGTLAEWQDGIAKCCSGNSRLTFGVSLAFAAPLLHLLDGEESGGFHLRGGSSTGKTTVIDVAGSVWGGGRGSTGYKQTWRVTANGAESIAAAHSDSLLCLDEIGQAQAREVGEVVYLLANEQGKSRARRDGSGRPRKTWRSLFFSSGEQSLAAKIAEAGYGRATAGMAVRLLDIPADAGSGLGVFEDLHGAKDGNAFVQKLKAAAASYYGTPIRTFLQQLTAPTRLAASAGSIRHIFIRDLEIENYDGQVHRAANRFGLVAAAGELATQMGITGWDEGAASEAAEKCFRAWLATRGGTGPLELVEGVRQVRRFIEANGESRFTSWTEKPEDPEKLINRSGSNRVTINRAGFKRRWHSEAPEEYYILPETFRDEVCRGFDWKALAQELVRRKILIPSPNNGPLSQAIRIPALGKTTRVYSITSAIFEVDE
jgi:putative DNA primase/helicase